MVLKHRAKQNRLVSDLVTQALQGLGQGMESQVGIGTDEVQVKSELVHSRALLEMLVNAFAHPQPNLSLLWRAVGGPSCDVLQGAQTTPTLVHVVFHDAYRHARGRTALVRGRLLHLLPTLVQRMPRGGGKGHA